MEAVTVAIGVRLDFREVAGEQLGLGPELPHEPTHDLWIAVFGEEELDQEDPLSVRLEWREIEPFAEGDQALRRDPVEMFVRRVS